MNLPERVDSKADVEHNKWLVSVGSNPLFDRCVGVVSIRLHHTDTGVINL